MAEDHRPVWSTDSAVWRSELPEGWQRYWRGTSWQSYFPQTGNSQRSTLCPEHTAEPLQWLWMSCRGRHSHTQWHQRYMGLKNKIDLSRVSGQTRKKWDIPYFLEIVKVRIKAWKLLCKFPHSNEEEDNIYLYNNKIFKLKFTLFNNNCFVIIFSSYKNDDASWTEKTPNWIQA